MLVGSPGRAWWVPMLSFAACLLFVGIAVLAAVLPTSVAPGTKPPPAHVGLWLALVGVASVAWWLAGIRRITRVGERISVRGVLRRVDVGPTAALGYEVRAAGRSASLVIYLTEGGPRHDVLSMMPFGTRRAERLVLRLTRILELQASPAAAAVVQADHDARAAAKAVIESHYRGKRGRVWAIALLVLVAYAGIMTAVTSQCRP